MKKRLLILPLLAMALAGCGESPNPNPNPNPDPIHDVVTLVSIDVTKQPTKTQYKEGETFDPAGMEVTATMSDGTKKVVTNYQISNQALTTSTTSVSISYEGKTASVTITVSPREPEKKDFTGVSFDSKTISYDGQPHTLEASGIPQGANVEYTGKDDYVVPGVYPMSVKITATGYNDLVLNATLTIIKANITGVSFVSKTIPYDGQPHTLEVSGLPEGANVEYTGKDNYVNAGVYNMTAKVTMLYHNDLVLNASLTISKLDFQGITFEDGSFEYDGNPHSIAITGTLPETATVTYTSNVEGIENSAVQPGNYEITATIKDVNFNDLVLKATLSITTKEVKRLIVSSGTSLFFANAKDDNKLYLYNPTNGIVKVSNSEVSELISIGDNKVMFITKSVLTSAIKIATYNEDKNTISTTFVYSTNAEYIQSTDGNIVYFVKNGLTDEKSGIFKGDFSGDEAIITCLSVGKAEYLTKLGNKLYFADGTNKNKLSSINISGENQTRTLLVDEKIKCLTTDGTSLYYTVDNILGNYIAKCNTSGTQRKLTSDQGINFSFNGEYLYYINTDKLNTFFYGKGIYRVPSSSVSDNNNPGELVYEASADGFSSLHISSDSIYYYDLADYKLICNDGVTSVDLLDGFVKPADPAPLSLGSKLIVHNGLVYYLDLYDGKTLHSYNPQTKANIRLTSDKVADFAFIGDYIYLNMVSYLVNNNLYRINLINGGEPELINKFDSTSFVSDGTYLYYSEGGSTHKCDLDGQNDVVIYKKGSKDLTIVNGKLYFVARATLNDYLYCMDNPAALTGVGEPTELVRCEAISYNEKMYIISKDDLYELDLSTNAVKGDAIAEDVNYMNATSNGLLYYLNTNKAATEGLYHYVNGVSTLKLLCNNTYYPSTFDFFGNDIYFIDCQGDGLFGLSHLCVLSNNIVTEVA